MAMNLSRTRLTNYTVTWNSVDLGAVDEIGVELEIGTKEIKVGSVGDAILGERVINMSGQITVDAREIDLDQLQDLMPWFTSGSIPLLPGTVHKDLYDYAQLLRLHPIDQGATVTQDLCFIKAVPVIGFPEADGEEDNVLTVTFKLFPDRAQLPSLVYGYVGNAP